MKSKRIFLDMDGVIVDWYGGAIKLARTDHDVRAVVHRAFTDGLFCYDGRLDNMIENKGLAFWAELEPFPWTMTLVEALKREVNAVVFLSNPSCYSQAYHGKQAWLEKHGFDPNALVVTRDKSQLVSHDPLSILVDDLQENVLKFEEKGGQAYLWDPRKNNGPDVCIKDVINFIKSHD